MLTLKSRPTSNVIEVGSAEARTKRNERRAPRSTSRQSNLISRNLLISGRRTSARLEPDMWVALFDIARREGRSIHDIGTMIDSRKPEDCSLTAAIRVFITAYFRAAATEEGHARAGHGFGNIAYPEAAPMPRRISLRNGTNGLPWR